MEAPEYVATPEISISPKGRVQASWYGEDSDSLTIEFQENSETFFIFLVEGQALEGVRPANDESLVKILEALSENPLRWAD